MTSPKRRAVVVGFVALLAALGCRGPRPERPPGSCTHVHAERELQGAVLCEDVWSCVRPPGGRFDRVGLHRLAACQDANGPVVLYLPGMHMNGELPITEPRYDFRVYLAAAGLRTWGLDYRTHAVPADAGSADLETLRRWSADVFVDDAAWAAAFIRGTDPGRLYVAGFSQGAAFGYRLAARKDEPLAGLVILDGAAGGGRGPGEGGPAIDVGGARLPYPERARLLADVAADPTRPSSVVGYRTAGEALADILYSAQSFGGQGGVAARYRSARRRHQREPPTDSPIGPGRVAPVAMPRRRGASAAIARPVPKSTTPPRASDRLRRAPRRPRTCRPR